VSRIVDPPAVFWFVCAYGLSGKTDTQVMAEFDLEREDKT
jgi:hypothetical protein